MLFNDLNPNLYTWFWCDNTVDLERLGNSQKARRHESAFLTASSCTGCKVHRWPTAFLGNECVDILAMRREWRERGDHCRLDHGEIFFEVGFPSGLTKFTCLFICWLNRDLSGSWVDVADEVWSYEKWAKWGSDELYLLHKMMSLIQVCGTGKIMAM